MPRGKDPMWDHVIDEGAGKILCKFCNRIFSGCTITRVKYHLAKITSKDISQCVGVPDWAKEQALKSIGDIKARSKRQKIADFWKPASSSGSSPSMVTSTLHSTSVATTGELTQPTISSMLRKVEKEEADKAIVNCIVANNLSFNLLRTEEFKRACKAISEAGPGYQPPSSETARTRLLDVLKQDVDAYVESVKQSWSHSGCSLMSDTWTDARGRPHINLLASSPRGTVFLKSECTVGKKKSGDFIFKFICDTIEEIGPMNVVQFISYNASNYISAGYKLVERYGHIFKINCAAHCINIMFKEMDELSFVASILEDAKKILKFLYKHQFVTDLMHSFIGNRELKKPCATRFASNFLSLQSILHEDKGLQYLVASPEWRDSPICRSDEGNEVKVIIQENIFWESGKQIINTIEPLIRVMRIVDGNDSTSGYIYDALDRAKEKIKEVLQNDPEKYEPFWKIIDDRWNKSLHSDLHAASAYLNPQFHYKGIATMDGEVKEGLEKVVMKTIVELADRNTIISELRIYHQMDRDKLFTPLAVEVLKDYHPKPLSESNIAGLGNGSRLRVAYQGLPGAYSEAAALKAYSNCEAVPCEQFETAFFAVDRWLVDRAVLPIENSLGGSIHRNYDLLLKNKLHIVGEVKYAVRHCLLANFGINVEDLKRVLSHPQALAQCEHMLTKLGVVREAVDDTAGAAKFIAINKLKDAGAVASSKAAEIYGLDILAQDIQDDSDNVTRFLMLAREPIIPGSGRPFKTSIVFSLEEGPGVLFKALAVFALREINLTKIESRPRRERPLRTTDDGSNGSLKYFDYLFYVDFEASMADPNAQNALKHLEEFATSLRVLGSYPMDTNQA